MDKKNFYVNLIIIVFIGFFVYSAFNLSKFTGAKDKNDFKRSIKIGGFELTPILISPSPALSEMPNSGLNIFNNNNNSNLDNLENPTPTVTAFLFSNSTQDLSPTNYKTNNNNPTRLYNNYQNNNDQKNNSHLEEFVYYTQKTNYPIPPDNKCTMNQVGCGPTTVAMIVASYIDRNITPEKIVDHFLKNKYSITCNGSYFKENKKALEDFGVKTTEIIALEKSDEFFSNKNKMIKKEIVNYIKNGWTIFAFGYFSKKDFEKKFGHFFWVIDADNEKILAYDPYYGRNVNLFKYYPDIMYRGIFFVRK